MSTMSPTVSFSPYMIGELWKTSSNKTKDEEHLPLQVVSDKLTLDDLQHIWRSMANELIFCLEKKKN